ncbi:Protein kinase-like domain protein [Cordyceps fumosorosea ARSEF 2679]|uniref:non-specific serine/threonine protein kinase n=1 Tax=Cordyceps fumosorosea (strain ARSEF 2679) TaxID=1081104 RepID=A0A167SUU9_CORFA|nr:Protein kinase-like domain protein [Cordyceps fumosorosea ARSEF 2679]OAA59945.1 Protein kinase-like domain protein [Cordyceps fumosorosea ARSEF 2679]
MPAPKELDLTTIVVFFKVIQSPRGTNILTLAENHRFLLDLAKMSSHAKRIIEQSMGGVEQEGTLRDVLAFKFRENIHAPRGWLVGSAETDDCDLKLAKDNHSGISRFHFCIDISPENRPRITNLCRNDIHIYGQHAATTAALRANECRDIEGPVVIHMGAASLRIWRPILTKKEQAKFVKNATAFSMDFMQAVPKPPRRNPDSTSDIRFGLRNTAYRKVKQVKLRTGSFGSVVKVIELRSGNFFAAKMPHPDFRRSVSAERQNWELIQREFRSLTELHHENIVRTIETIPGDLGTEPPWLVLEWVEQSLCNYSPSARELPDILRQISSGLSYMHEKGFTHRDIKPANILIRRNGPTTVAKIADIGFARNGGARNTYTFSGTLLYMAPELWKSQNGYSNAVDLWSLGMIALEILTKGGIFYGAPSDRGHLPIETEYLAWIRSRVLPRRDYDPVYRPLIDALLSEQAVERWKAHQCERWLLRHCRDAELAEISHNM